MNSAAFAKAAANANPAVRAQIEKAVEVHTSPAVANLDLIHRLVRMYKEHVGESTAVSNYGRKVLQSKNRKGDEKIRWATTHTKLFRAVFDAYRAKILSTDPQMSFSWLDGEVNLKFHKKGEAEASFPLSALYKALKVPSKDVDMVQFEEVLFRIFLNAAESFKDEEAVTLLKAKVAEYSDGSTQEQAAGLEGLIKSVRSKVIENGLTDDDNLSIQDVGTKAFPIALEMLGRPDVQGVIQSFIGGMANGGVDIGQSLRSVATTVSDVNEAEQQRERDESDGGGDGSAASAAAAAAPNQ